MVSKEAAIVIGPILHQMARRQGLVYTEVDGDQPGLLIGLISWARTLGLKIRVAGKASEYDFVLAEGDTLVWKGRRFPGSGLKSLWRENGRGWRVLAHSRRQAVLKCGVPLRTVPDYCELGLVANATGFIPDRPELHTPLLRPIELAEAFQLESEGGMLKCFRKFDRTQKGSVQFRTVGNEPRGIGHKSQLTVIGNGAKRHTAFKHGLPPGMRKYPPAPAVFSPQ
jgi:hypothetical protein